jgi:hypothetical protein
MRYGLWLAATAAIFILPAVGLCQQQDPPAQQSSAAQTPPAQEDSIAAAARRAREQKKDSTKPAKVFDNDNIPTKGGVSTVGNSSPASDSSTTAGGGVAPVVSSSAGSGRGEKFWRQKFADLRKKLEADQAALDLMQRELGTLELQYYPDPVKGMQQSLTRSDINDKVAKIDAMKKQIQADQQAISDAEDELRKSGGDSGWSR